MFLVILILIASAFLFGLWPVIAFVGNAFGFIVLLALFVWVVAVIAEQFRKRD